MVNFSRSQKRKKSERCTNASSSINGYWYRCCLSRLSFTDCKYSRLFSNCKTNWRTMVLNSEWKVCIPSELVTWTILYIPFRCRESLPQISHFTAIALRQTLNGAIEMSSLTSNVTSVNTNRRSLHQPELRNRSHACAGIRTKDISMN